MLKEKAKVYLLPTKEKGAIVIHENGTLYPFREDKIHLYNEKCTYHHLYITSNENVEDGDWCICIGDIYYEDLSIEDHNPKILKYTGNEFGTIKIIATTDTSLKKEICRNFIGKEYDLPQPSRGFISKYIDSYKKGIVIEDIFAEYEEVIINNSRISLPNSVEKRIKISSKDNTITIYPIKSSWTKEEVIALHKANCERLTNSYTSKDIEWIENNLY